MFGNRNKLSTKLLPDLVLLPGGAEARTPLKYEFSTRYQQTTIKSFMVVLFLGKNLSRIIYYNLCFAKLRRAAMFSYLFEQLENLQSAVVGSIIDSLHQMSISVVQLCSITKKCLSPFSKIPTKHFTVSLKRTFDFRSSRCF